jgi:hypothetical protein
VWTLECDINLRLCSWKAWPRFAGLGILMILPHTNRESWGMLALSDDPVWMGSAVACVVNAEVELICTADPALKCVSVVLFHLMLRSEVGTAYVHRGSIAAKSETGLGRPTSNDPGRLHLPPKKESTRCVTKECFAGRCKTRSLRSSPVYL